MTAYTRRTTSRAVRAGGLLTLASGLTGLALAAGMSLASEAHAQSVATPEASATVAPTQESTTAVCQWVQPNGVSAMGSCPPPDNIKNYTVRQISTAPADSPSVVRLDRRFDAERADDVAAHIQQQQRDLQAGVSNVQTADTPSVTAANLALQQAEARRLAGEQPLAGERRGLANGKSRLLPTYFDRQDKLATDVETAREDVIDAREAAQD